MDKYLAETGNKAIGCFPVYTPEEIVYAAGMLPVGMWGGQTEVDLAKQYFSSIRMLHNAVMHGAWAQRFIQPSFSSHNPGECVTR